MQSVVTHDLVKEMLKTTLNDGNADASQEGIVYEPKLTRSKMKEVLEKGKVGSHWYLVKLKLFLFVHLHTCLHTCTQSPVHVNVCIHV